MSDTSDWDNNVHNPLFMENLARGYIKRHGEGAHLYAVEKLMKAEQDRDDIMVEICKRVLVELDKLNNESEV